MQFSKDGNNFDLDTPKGWTVADALDTAIKYFSLKKNDFIYLRFDNNDKPVRLPVRRIFEERRKKEIFLERNRSKH